nr:MAG: hypothetical protein BA873_07575 [Desulfobulbaceae bacterium C00003063]
MLFNEIHVRKIFINYGADHTHEKGDIGPGSLLDMHGGMTAKIDFLRVDDNEIGAVSCCLFYLQGNHRMGLGRVGAYRQDSFGTAYFVDGV